MSSTEDDPRWTAVMQRDVSADGTFFYSVATTGVYCRPSCASRRANPKNVAFHTTTADAEHAGFRPCRRCEPHLQPKAQRQAAMVEALCRFIESAETPPSLEALAARVELSPHHLHRVFKAVTGVTPKAYAKAHRAGRVRDALRTSGSVTDAIYDAGFNASSRFYESEALGMTPTAFRAGGADETIRYAVGACSLGAILVAATDRGVCSVLLGDDPDALARDLAARFPRAQLTPGDDDFRALVTRVVALVEAPASSTLPLDIRGTAFQQKVWTALTRIPVGATRTYAEVAAAIGAPKSARAVAAACAANPLAVLVPCHRVVRADGSLSGYRWGVERKRTLIDRERSQT
ncbi:MAG: bifunctional DNA-binding transcriptional regulator/O6-methylguanine-DNA methyltransferase Ada [Deltaproteobacteria bacterium]|jgi:AraC family transcriptional regulator of adaptative response/methylated-DNA-[protein]-cysteine methyltransferase